MSLTEILTLGTGSPGSWSGSGLLRWGKGRSKTATRGCSSQQGFVTLPCRSLCWSIHKKKAQTSDCVEFQQWKLDSYRMCDKVVGATLRTEETEKPGSYSSADCTYFAGWFLPQRQKSPDSL